ETNDLETAVVFLGQDKVDHMDWDLIHRYLVRNYHSLRLPNGKRFKFSLDQIDYIREQRDTYKRSWAEIRDDLNKDPYMEVKTTPNRVKNAYHNATKKRLRNQRQQIQDSEMKAQSDLTDPTVYNKVFGAGPNAYNKFSNVYNENNPRVDNETDSTNFMGNNHETVKKTSTNSIVDNLEVVKTDSTNSTVNKASLNFILNEKDQEKKE
ncbi:11673_t:CDS:2, partial [Gigaspora rosea]